MSKIKVVCTSTGCLDYAPERYLPITEKIDRIRVHMFFHGEEFLEGEGFTPEEFYEALLNIQDTKKNLPHTAIPTYDEVAAVFQKAIDEGYDQMVIIALSSYLGGTWNFIRLVAKDFAEKIKTVVIDAKTTCFCEGIMAIKAQTMVNEGKEVPEIVREIEWIKAHDTFMGVAGKLDYLILNGRLKGGKAYFGKMLSICPVVGFNEAGELAPITNAMGQTAALKKADEILVSIIGDRKPEDYTLFRLYTGEPMRERQRKMENNFPTLKPNHEDVIMSTVTGCHIGPYCAGYGYIPTRREDEPLDELPDYYFEQLGIER